MKLFQLPAVLILTLGMSLSAQAEIFKWVDAEGNTHYSQTPPQDKDTKAEDIGDDIGMAAGTGSGSTKKADGKEDEVETARKEGEENKVKHKTYCDQQASALQQLLANPVIRWKSEDVDKILTAKERKSKIAEIEKNIKEMCNADILDAKAKVGAK